MGLTSGAGCASAEPSLPRHYRGPPSPAVAALPTHPAGRDRRSALGTAAGREPPPRTARAHAARGRARAPPAGGRGGWNARAAGGRARARRGLWGGRGGVGGKEGRRGPRLPLCPAGAVGERRGRCRSPAPLQVS